MRILPILALLALAQPQAPAPPPDTEIFLATLSASGATPSVIRPVNISNSPGYDNQPSFTPDGRSVLFTSVRGAAAAGGEPGRASQTDIYRYDIASRSVARVTNTPESEYSPTVTPDRGHISVVRVEADGTQRLWQFTLDGKDPQVVLENVKPVGYHAWTDPQTLVLFVLGQPSTLQIADTRSGRSDTVARDVGRSLQPIPLRGTVSFVEREAGGDRPPRLHIKELDPKTRAIVPLVDMPIGAREADVAWAPDGLLLVAKDDVLYGWKRGDSADAWRKIVDLAPLGLTGVTRLAVSPAGDRIAFVTQTPRAQ